MEGHQRSAILQLEILSGIAKGLTHTSDLGSDEVDPDLQAENERIKAARDEPGAVQLREYIFTAIRGVVEVWPADAAVGQVCESTFVLFIARHICRSRARCARLNLGIIFSIYVFFHLRISYNLLFRL